VYIITLLLYMSPVDVLLDSKISRFSACDLLSLVLVRALLPVRRAAEPFALRPAFLACLAFVALLSVRFVLLDPALAINVIACQHRLRRFYPISSFLRITLNYRDCIKAEYFYAVDGSNGMDG
jgi:hypothetical protein